MIEALILLLVICLIIAFPRQANNLFIMVWKRKDYVVIRMKKHNSGFFETWYKVPDINHNVKIKKGTYYLPIEFADHQIGKRYYFLVDQNDAIPEYKGRSDKDIIFHAMEFQNALSNKVSDQLFRDPKDKTLLIVLLALLISIGVALYAVSAINDMNNLMEQLKVADALKNTNITIHTGK